MPSKRQRSSIKSGRTSFGSGPFRCIPSLRSKKWSKKDSRRRRSEIIVQRSRVLKPLEVGINRIEKEIELRDQQLSQLHQAMQRASQQQDGNRIGEISRDIHTCQSAIDNLFEELERLSEDYDRQKNEFEHQLAAINTDEI